MRSLHSESRVAFLITFRLNWVHSSLYSEHQRVFRREQITMKTSNHASRSPAMAGLMSSLWAQKKRQILKNFIERERHEKTPPIDRNYNENTISKSISSFLWIYLFFLHCRQYEWRARHNARTEITIMNRKKSNLLIKKSSMLVTADHISVICCKRWIRNCRVRWIDA